MACSAWRQAATLATTLPLRSAVPCALAPSGASYRVSPVSWPDFAAADQADLVRIIKRKLKKIQYRPT